MKTVAPTVPGSPTSLDRSQADGLIPYSEFRATVARHVVQLEVSCAHPESFRGRLTAVSGGGVSGFGVLAAAHSVHRTEALVVRAPQRFLKVSHIERGTGLILQDGREAVLRPGDMTIYDTNRPYSLVFEGGVQMSVLMFPGEMLGLPGDALSRLMATRLGGGVGVAPVARAFLSSLSQQLADLPERIAGRMVRGSIELVAMLLESQLDALPPGNHATLLRRIYEYVDTHLAIPELGPEQIAKAHYISVRHLHALFAEQGVTVSALIRARRLERSYDELSDPRRPRRAIAAVAAANGFVSPAHFSRAFRARFGVAPTETRRQTLEAP